MNDAQKTQEQLLEDSKRELAEISLAITKPEARRWTAWFPTIAASHSIFSRNESFAHCLTAPHIIGIGVRPPFTTFTLITTTEEADAPPVGIEFAVAATAN